MPRSKSKQSKKHRSGEIPVGSFSDIAFLLIIYFLVATTLMKVKAITSDMPSGKENNASTAVDETPTINLVGEEIHFKNSPVTLKVLNEKLKVLNLHQASANKKVILLECSKATPYRIYFKALAAISTNGGIVALVEEED